LVLSYAIKKHFPVFVEQNIDGVFIVSCPVFQGCRSYGETIDEALHNIQEVIERCQEEQESEEPANTFIGIRDIELAV
jgi:predicted RNase H-like HicB family nuclease